MLSRWFRSWLMDYVHPFARFLLKIGITPNGLTLAGLAVSTLAGSLIALGWLLPAAGAVALEGILDSLDGELARQSGRASARGAFLDSVCDHYGDFAIHLGITTWSLTRGYDWIVLLALASLFGSVMGSHIRSKGEVMGIETQRVGLFTRMERTVVLLAGLLTGWMLPALIVMVIGVHLSAFQRLVWVLREGKKMERPAAPNPSAGAS
jgi:CDP-diacylglycerol--glycerol-3-phosphate 3-phosphatidyltransferase